MVLALADNASNGYIVKSLDPNGVIDQDGRINIGDYIVTLNGKSLRGLSKTDVLAILDDCEQRQQQQQQQRIRRCKIDTKNDDDIDDDDIIIKYIPQSEIAKCLATTMKPEIIATTKTTTKTTAA
nr:pro-interleukin-16-like [Dermatophagoides farinae]